ncbi:MAG: hypothetical protein Q7S56_03840 [Nanoarchaeota archaeon]|nr:hypothetical protein [Nanoarchaeota archaeon]
MKKEEVEKNQVKAQIHTNISITLIFITCTIFAFVITVNNDILKDDYVLALQLTLALPFLMSSSLAKSKIAEAANYIKSLDNFGYLCYIIGYTFFVNTIGLLLATFVSVKVSMIFFGANIVMALLYSVVITTYNKKQVFSRLLKDGLFILLIVLGGILPALGYY